ncbi:MAG TPA: AAA family ATPase, partial [Chloroflexota bacterium]
MDRAQPADNDELAKLAAGLDRPVDPEPLVGRRRELEAVRARLLHPAVDLLTLTGPAGVGKTRLAREIAADLADALDGRVLCVDLPPDADLSVVATTIARRLELPAGRGRAAAPGRAADRPALLVLEHAEGALATAPAVAALRAACPDLKILLTARRPLRARGEQTFAVPPLEAPDPTGRLDLATVASSPAAELFVRRARAADPRFALRPDNCAAIGSICHRLAGLPLALELAARCCQRLPPSAILALLADRTGATGAGSAEQVPRWGALGRAAAASCRLMTPDERLLFRRLAVFVGGCTPDAAEAVCDDRAGLAGLVGRGLLRPGPGADATLRLHMPEAIRELARDLLAGSSEGEELARRHAAFFLALAEQASAGLAGANQRHWLDVLEREHDNLRAALRHYAEVGAAEPGLRLASALSRFWSTRGYLGEGRAWLGRFLRRGESTAQTRTRAQGEAARLAYGQGDDATAYALSSEGPAPDQAGGRAD